MFNLKYHILNIFILAKAFSFIIRIPDLKAGAIVSIFRKYPLTPFIMHKAYAKGGIPSRVIALIFGKRQCVVKAGTINILSLIQD